MGGTKTCVAIEPDRRASARGVYSIKNSLLTSVSLGMLILTQLDFYLSTGHEK